MQTGWLDPNGNFYPCETFEHVAVAEGIVNDLELVSRNTTHSDDILLEHGWAQISRSLLGMKEQTIYWNRFLTEHQKQFLRPYFEENDEPVSPMSLMVWEKEMDR